ncbi:DUF7513 family protein, partial [Halalkalicoccus jeotgali]
MSFLSKYFKGWSFRTTHPTLAPGTEVNVFLLSLIHISDG